MRGDFSAWNKDRSNNFRGTLHQQGRVLSDRDWNAQTEVIGEWQEAAGRDAFGAGVLAVPAELRDSFKVVNAAISSTGNENVVNVSLRKGRAWADGLMVELHRDVEPPTLPAGVDAIRRATYLGPPIQFPPLPDPDDTPAAGSRDAVILETWLEELSQFQMPDLLLEPALGGVDTTERVHTASRLRLYRMLEAVPPTQGSAGQPADTCDSIIPKLKDVFDTKGKLSVELNPNTNTGGDCPVAMEGGFTGFEHRLYRFEIAETGKTEPYFKWSHFNGGLVGRGVFHPGGPGADGKLSITHNQNAIVYSGSKKFYLEALVYDQAWGYWRVDYAVNSVTLESDGTLKLPIAVNDQFLGAMPPEKSGTNEVTHFFRLWNGIEKVSDFLTKKDFPNAADTLGLQVMFDTAATASHSPGDFWTFEVRAGDIGNPLILVGKPPTSTGGPVIPVPPQGIYYHRVPLAEVTWGPPVAIEDCRRVFQPLTRLKTCCTYRVGDGVSSHGDFKSIQAAVDALPAGGGEVCILPGSYVGNVYLKKRRNVILKGCGDRTRLFPENENEAGITLHGGENITIESLYIKNEIGPGILLKGDDQGGTETEFGPLTEISIDRLRIDAGMRSAIEMHTGYFVSVTNCRILVQDRDTEWPGVYLAGDDVHFEHNEIRVNPRPHIILLATEEPGATDFEKINDPHRYKAAEHAAGGLQIAGGSERVRVIDNLIIGGTGNGINLGSVEIITVEGNRKPPRPWHDKKGDICDKNPGHPPPPAGGGDGIRYEAGPPLYDILIERNRILCMGRNGIGVDAFFAGVPEGGAVGVANFPKFTFVLIAIDGLVIIGNTIERCLNRIPDRIPRSVPMGWGGIALSMVENLTVRDNRIAENGTEVLTPVCGIFLLYALGTEISRNHILNNGHKKTAEIRSFESGPRGGVHIYLARDASIDVSASGDRVNEPSGVPALLLHHNVIRVPLGRALTVTALHHLSVTDNYFECREFLPVLVDDGGVSLSVQILGLNSASFIRMSPSRAIAREGPSTPGRVDINALTNLAAFESREAGDGPDVIAYQTPEDRFKKAKKLFGSKHLNGVITFADNQIELFHDPRLGSDGLKWVASVLILSQHDVGFLGNQSFCRLNAKQSLLLANTEIIGTTVRVSDNSWMEGFDDVSRSAITYGLLNTTTDNQSTHCLSILGSLYLSRYNLVLIDAAAAYNAAGEPLEGGIDVTDRNFTSYCAPKPRKVNDVFPLNDPIRVRG